MPDLVTTAEQQFAYNIEVLGLPVGRAGQLAGVADPTHCSKRPEVMALRRAFKREMLARAAITKEDVVLGIRECIDDARILGDAATGVRGWSEIGKLLGHYEPQRIKIDVDTRTLATTVKHMTTDELLALTNQSEIIDVDFIEVSE